MGTWIEMISSVYYDSEEASFPAMGTWIEMNEDKIAGRNVMGRSLQWERGLKYILICIHNIPPCRSLQWERGLKCC